MFKWGRQLLCGSTVYWRVIAPPHYLCRVTFLECYVGVGTVTDLSLLENLFNLKHRTGSTWAIRASQHKKKSILCWQKVWYKAHIQQEKEMQRQNRTELQGMWNRFGSRTKLFKARRKIAESCYFCYILFLAYFRRCYGFHFYLDDQVDVWGRVGDGEDGGSGLCGLIHMWSVSSQEVFKLFWVQITVEVLWYLEGDRNEKFNFWEPEKNMSLPKARTWLLLLMESFLWTSNSGRSKMQNVTLRYDASQRKIEGITLEKAPGFM